ncbi:putative bifunctional diguanylate cyclase/phosphodiesterase [Terriglobus roseus]|uniref:PAS domain S-box-containing protein/diguanylate cyclase (GGDEF) domain-containing protein n=1 Tax=Terriglobus roseus TaxID=392734 RepID=A0A1H4K0T1_9BACT|nr:GGDEF domain-containing phosphodiesterase [Terriglobus roseus]SEB52037.1 PAS domain S-box-containing protein/diguanylate cyclase (GGDEF) domain-containing protein [Terriglobus roseus]
MPPSQDELRHQALIFAAVQTIGDGLILVDRENRIIYINPAAERLTGWFLQDASGKPLGVVFRIINAITKEPDWNPVLPTMEDDQQYLLLPNSLLLRKDGTEVVVEDSVNPIHDAAGEVIGATIVFRDVEKNRAILLQVLARAQRDPLTNLPNRAFFEETLNKLDPKEDHYALLYLDLDNFKAVNDTWGHLTGDVILGVLARRLRETAPTTSTVCRWGGDEFAVLLRNIRNSEEANGVLVALQAALAEPIALQAATIRINVSIGVALSSKGSVAGLLGVADHAMYHAKRADKERAARSDISGSPAFRRNFVHPPPTPSTFTETDMILHFQPIVDLATGRITGAEALARTRDTATLPADLITNAERNGTIIGLGQAVLRGGLRQQAEWRKAGHEDLCMSVNVSAIELLNPSCLHHLDRILEEESYIPGRVIIELTESSSLHTEQQSSLIKAMARRDLQIAIDDFGVGYSNLNYLRRLPISILKIDRDFLREMPDSDQDASLVRAMIALARSLKRSVIAEGVETEAQRKLLQEMRCAKGQGFLFSPAVPPDRFLTLLRSPPQTQT